MNALSVAFKDILIMLKDRGQILMLFLVPLFFILAFSAAFSLGGELEEQVITLPVVNLDPGGEMSSLLLENLNQDQGIQTEDYGQAEAETALNDQAVNMVLTIPAEYVFAGVKRRRWWLDLRLWAIGVLAFIFLTYYIF